MFLVHFFSGGEVTAGGVFALSAVLLIISAAIHTLLFSDDFSVDSSVGWNVVLLSMYTFSGLHLTAAAGVTAQSNLFFMRYSEGAYN